MKLLIFLMISMALFSGCEDKVNEPTTKYVTTSSICPDPPPSSVEADHTSPIKFLGIQDIIEVTKDSAKLKWIHIPGISSYHIIKHDNENKKIMNIIRAPKAEFTLQNLKSDTQYQYSIRAMDEAGLADINTMNISFNTLPNLNFRNLKSLKFSGSQTINIGASSKFKIQEKFSLSFWFKIDSKSSTDTRLLTFHKGTEAATALSIGVKDEFVEVHYTNKTGVTKKFSKLFNYYDNTWHQINLSANESSFSLFIDTVEYHLQADDIINFGKHSAFIGSFSKTDKGFNGLMDELLIYNVDFSQDDVTQIFNTGFAMDPREHSKAQHLIHWYQFGDHSNDNSKNLKDLIGSQNGIPVGFQASDYVTDTP